MKDDLLNDSGILATFLHCVQLSCIFSRPEEEKYFTTAFLSFHQQLQQPLHLNLHLQQPCVQTHGRKFVIALISVVFFSCLFFDNYLKQINNCGYGLYAHFAYLLQITFTFQLTNLQSCWSLQLFTFPDAPGILSFSAHFHTIWKSIRTLSKLEWVGSSITVNSLHVVTFSLSNVVAEAFQINWTALSHNGNIVWQKSCFFFKVIIKCDTLVVQMLLQFGLLKKNTRNLCTQMNKYSFLKSWCSQQTSFVRTN